MEDEALKPTVLADAHAVVDFIRSQLRGERMVAPGQALNAAKRLLENVQQSETPPVEEPEQAVRSEALRLAKEQPLFLAREHVEALLTEEGAKERGLYNVSERVLELEDRIVVLEALVNEQLLPAPKNPSRKEKRPSWGGLEQAEEQAEDRGGG